MTIEQIRQIIKEHPNAKKSSIHYFVFIGIRTVNIKFGHWLCTAAIGSKYDPEHGWFTDRQDAIDYVCKEFEVYYNNLK